MSGRTSVLKQLMQMAEGLYADSKDIGPLGRVFTQSADVNPNYFVRAGRNPETNLRALEAKHGLGSERAVGLYDKTLDAVSVPMPKGGTAYISRRGRAHDMANVAAMRRAMQNGDVNLNTEVHTIDTMSLPAGSGGGRQLYPFAYEHILGLPDAMNVSEGLSNNNMTRRSLAMSEAMEKYGARAGQRILIDNDQLAPLGGKSRELEYQALDTDNKVGLLNAIVAPTTVDRVDGALRSLYGGKAFNREELIEEAQRLGIHGQRWEPTTDVGPEYFTDLSDLLGGIGRREVGVDSLRRAALTYDAVGKGLTAADVASQPYLTNRLARKHGGGV